jgi:RNA polymerase sigma-70 factor (ECF subfamily)
MPNNWDTISDEDLCRRSLGNDEEAFRKLVERHAQALFRFAYHLTRTEEDAEDIAQECFIRLHQNLRRLDLQRPIKPWLYHVCKNLCRSLATKKKFLTFSSLKADEDGDETQAESIPDEARGPMEGVLQQDAAYHVRNSLAVLPEKYRIVLSLFYFESLSYEEIADILRLPVNTVRTHLKRAKEALKASPSLSPLML